MATIGTGSYSMVCRVCNQSIEIYGGDFQNSLALHNLKAHPDMERFNKNQTRPAKKKSTSNSGNDSVTCPICKERVEIINNNYNKSLQAHFESHNKVNIKPRSDDQLYTFDGIRNWIDHSENSDNRSTSSRDNSRRNQYPSSPLNVLPMGLKQHRGFFTDNKDSLFCNICRLSIDSSSVQEHIKTKTHEDNVVLCLKQRFPTHLQNSMDFVSFYGSNLCCNLCRCKIDLSSFNVHETIVNILFHNADDCHNNKRSKNQNGPQSHSTEINYETIIKSLAEKYSEINENKHLIKTSIEPQFKCIWCDKNITYSPKDHVLAENFIAHFSSTVHKKSKMAFSILKAYRMMNLTGYENHKLVIANGGISCVQCKCKIESDINKVLLHITGAKQIEENNLASSNTNRPKTMPDKKPQKNFKSNETKKGESYINVNPMFTNMGAVGPLKVNLQVILQQLEPEFGKINCIIQKEEGSVMCLICTCIIPATSQNIRDHISGNSHSKNIESQLGQLKGSKITSLKNSDNIGEVCAGSRINELFYSLPFSLQDDKKYIKDSPIDGYLICTLCNQVINPEYLRDHLLDRRHMVEKQAQSGILVV